MLFLFCCSHVLSAQVASQPAASDSLEHVSPDSLQTPAQIQPDSGAARLPLPVFVMPDIRLRPDSSAHFDYIFEDLFQLGMSTLPLLPVRAGEIGQPRYFAAGALPARALTHIVDGVLWPPGVYGTTDLSGLPDAAVDALSQMPLLPAKFSDYHSGNGLNFTTDSLHFNTPFSRAEYVKGPYGAEATRVRFGRAFSQRLTGFINFTVSNADGFENQNQEFVRVPYDGFKVGAKLDYRINAAWHARYRYFLSRHEAGIAAPFFPEEWQTGGGGRHKETRSFHTLDLARQQAFSARLFLWRIGEELNDPAAKIRHDLRDVGVEAKWQWQRQNFTGAVATRAGRETLASPTLDYDARFYQNANAHVAARLSDHVWLNAAADIHHKSDWPVGYALAVTGIFKVNHSLHVWLGFEQRQIPPAIGERNNTLSYFFRNTSLQAVNLQHAQSGLAWQSKTAEMQLVFGGAWWHDGFYLQPNPSDTTASLQNSAEAITTPALQFRGSVRPFKRVKAGLIWAHTIREVPQQFWFWHQPRFYGRIHLETSWQWFGRSLEVSPRVAMRLLGERASPDFAALPESITFTHLPAASLLDIQLRLRYGDGALFLAWENLLNKDLQWRAGVHDLGRVFRWGFWWTFLN